ncbi:uncharacterized protein LOC128680085 isoform X2 [Plodia interpunctella]|uniref:uncharacterized protein LOC128680085 isoform X2 n=1 Tax=Plodia interpunctella TaxID=58824 RepID=UPI0023676D3F|nr:uncharacterized protein LOC128680085 isoform X2 [Plodia interpunctella]
MLQPRLISGCEMGGKKLAWSFVCFAVIFTSLVSCQDLSQEESIEATRIKREGPENRAFNTNGIVYDNSPWRPGRDMEIVDRPVNEEDDRKLKNLATRIMSNGVEVLVKDKSSDGKNDQRKLKFIHVTSLKPPHLASSPSPKQSLLSSAVATVVNHQHMSALFPLHQLMQHNYIIKTCMTTYTYLTTVVQNKRSAISTFETIVSVVTTESLTNLYASDLMADIKPTKTKYMEVKTIQPSTPSNMYVSNFPKIDKRIDSHEEDNFDLLQPSETGHVPCTTSCSCSHTKTEGLKTKYTHLGPSSASKYGLKTSKYGNSKLDLRPTSKESLDKKTHYGPYEFETSSHVAPTDRIVEKYTEVINDYSEENPSSVEESELLTNEQAPVSVKVNKISNKTPEKNKPEKINKPNKNKFVVADLLKLGSLGIKGLSQLAPVIEKMTGGFIKRQENKTVTTTTVKPAVKITAYNVDKRVDADVDFKQNNFPIYIPVDEMETSESQNIFTNATLHQNLAWAAEHKQPKAHIVRPKIVHESPLVNGGIPISPGEIITANSDVIVGKPAVGGPLTLAASGIKLHNPVNPPPIDSFVAANEEYAVEEKPLNVQTILSTKVDDSYDLRPPDLPRLKPKPQSRPRPSNITYFSHQNYGLSNKMPHRLPSTIPHVSDNAMKTEHIKTTNVVLGNHGRPAFLDYIPSLAKPENNLPLKQHIDFSSIKENTDQDESDNSASSSEVINTHVRTDGEYAITGNIDSTKQFLVDIQPSRVANVLIPHGSSTALVFAGSSEPHKTGDYVDDPLPYPEPGYFGSFSIDAPQMTNVHNVAPTNNKQFVANTHIHQHLDSYKLNVPLPHKDQPFRNDIKPKWKDLKRPVEFNKIPPPTSNQETHVHFGPQITSYDPDIYNPNNGEFQKYNKLRGDKVKDGKEVIDKEYENYLAVPPLPPKLLLNQEKNQYDKSKPYNQKPIVHTKPVQDMKVFLNIQHPIPNAPTPQQQTPKVTSEIYFAAQAPISKPSPTYTVHIPHGTPSHNSYLHKPSTTNTQLNTSPNSSTGQLHNTFSIMSSTPTSNKSIATGYINDQENTYTVTLNTATNVANNVGEGQVIGSSVPVDIVSSSNNDALNTNIPIGTNFAITVDDGPTPFESYNLQENQNPPTVYVNHPHRPIEVAVTGDNRWNKSTAAAAEFKPQPSNNPLNDYYDYKKYETKQIHKEVRPSGIPTVNSHANFPMINDHPTTGHVLENMKPVTEYQEENKNSEQKRPAKLIPNIPTNSHGWYSSVIMNENNLNNIKVDSTTRKGIPLTNEYNSDSLPEFGQKITSVGKPPTDYWVHNNQPPQVVVSNINVGKPFTRPSTESPVIRNTPAPTKQYSSPNYIPHNFDNMRQPAYDIPIRDNSDETTTIRVITSTEKLKPVYENSEEIYDGEEEAENLGEIDGEVSSESMKVPVVSSSNEDDVIKKPTPTITLLQEEAFKVPTYPQKDETSEFNPGTQTEKPFRNKTNTNFQSNTIKPIYENDSNLKPRPFTINAMTSLDHQLQQPHWQINQLMENATNISYEENIDLNMGEEIDTAISTKRPSTHNVPYRHSTSDMKYKKPSRPTFVRPNNSNNINDSNIITSTVHIKDKKPLIVEKANDKSTLPTFTLPATIELNRTSSEIIDLSPPPPTMDYSFRPSTNDEMIMGMSPPPPRTPPAIRIPSRIPSTPRPILPARTPPPYINKPRRTLPPRLPPTQKPVRKPSNRDDVSTYRPTFDINNIRRPIYNDQPSSQLLPPPKEIPSRINTVSELPSLIVSASSVPNLVFPTPISSGWLTSSGIEFSSSFNFGPTSIQFPDKTAASKVPESLEDSYSYSYEIEPSSTEKLQTSSEKPASYNNLPTSKEVTPSTESIVSVHISSTEENVSDFLPNESSQEEASTEKIRGQGFKNRPRKPYPIRHDDKKSTSTKYKIPVKPTATIRPTRTLSRPEILYPTRHTSIRKIVRPIPTRSTTTSSSIIESSESSIEDEFIQPTDVMKDNSIRTSVNNFSHVSIQPQSSVATPILNNVIPNVKSTHHNGNEVKISDDAIPTKTEFKTTVVTLTKTLSEPPKTVSSIGYVNLTHTLTVTHTKTSLVSLSEGAVTQTLVLTNTHTSTIIDVITEVQTQVQPTTIIETVTKHIPVPVEPTPVQEVTLSTKAPLDDISMSSEENENLITRDKDTKPVQNIETEGEGDNDTFFVVMNKSQNGGSAPPVSGDIETGDYDGVTRNEQVNSNGVSQVLFGEILLAGTPYLETTNVNPGVTYGKECQPDCKASRNERCQRIDGLMKCVCRPGFARMFPDRPCKPTYTYSVKLALGSQGRERLYFHERLSDNSSKEYLALAVATHEGINRMVMQSDLRDVFHGVHITGFSPVQMKDQNGDGYQGVINNFYVQLSDNAHESRLKEVIEKYLRTNNYSLGGTEVHAAGELVDRLEVNDFDECTSGQFHDCSEHAQCFNLRGTYTCSCLEGFADLSVNTLYPGRICSAEPVGCERCNYHGACYSRDDRRVLCECFQWYAGSSCQINLKVVLISLVVAGAALSAVLAACAVVSCSKRTRPEPRSIVACIQSMPSLHQSNMPSKQRADRRALISERGESGDTASMQNASLPYMPAKKQSSSKKCVVSEPPAHAPPPPPAPAVMIPRARLHPHHDSRENIARKRSLELSSEAKLISYLESGTVIPNDEMRRKHSMESSYSANKDRHNKQGALVSAGFKVSTTIRPDESGLKDRDDMSSIHKADLEAELSRYDTMRKSYSQEDISEWTDAERRIGELTLSEARSVGGTLPASTGRAASSTRLTHQTSDVSEFDSL